MTEETLETIILGHIAKELKDEIQIGRQSNLAKTITQALRIPDVVGRSEQFTCSCGIPPAIRLCEGVETCLKCGESLSK
jgi:hypothetical protein